MELKHLIISMFVLSSAGLLSTPANANNNSGSGSCSLSTNPIDFHDLSIPKQKIKLYGLRFTETPEILSIQKEIEYLDTRISAVGREITRIKNILNPPKYGGYDGYNDYDVWDDYVPTFAKNIFKGKDSKKEEKPEDTLTEKEKSDYKIEIQRLETTKESLKEMKDSKTEELLIAGEKHLPKARKSFQERVKELKAQALVNEVLGVQVLNRLNKKNTVALYFGSAGIALNESRRNELQEAVETLIERGYNIIYDANSRTADIISTAAGRFGLGISSGLRQSHATAGAKVIEIQNVFTRLEAYTHAEMVLVDRHSVVGAALRTHDKVDGVITSKITPKYKLKDWEKERNDDKRNAGIKYTSEDLYTNLTEAINKTKHFPGSGFGVKRIPGETRPILADRGKEPGTIYDIGIEHLALSALDTLTRYIEKMTEGYAFTKKNGGAATFGSSKYDKVSTPENYEISYFLASHGASVTTGGSGGAMHVANAGAWDAGGVSIGIPIAGRYSLSGEKHVFSDVQTTTLTAENYHDRIPWLLHGKELVNAVPGGSGTTKEIAATLLKMTESPDLSSQLILVDKEYYSLYFKWFRSLDMNASVLDRVHLVNDATEYKLLVERLIREDLINASNLFRNPIPEAVRNPAKGFEIPKPKFNPVGSSYTGNIKKSKKKGKKKK